MDSGKMRVDTVRFQRNYQMLNEMIEQKQNALNESVGFPVNVGSSKDLKALFIDKCHCDPLRMNLKSGRLSFAKDVIERMDTPYTTPVLEMKSLVAVQKYFKIAERSISPSGYIDFSLVVGTTGRLYAKDPCVMSFPAEIRECIVPEPGRIFLAGDYVNQELTIIAHIVGEHGLIQDIRAGFDPFSVIAQESGVARDDVKTTTYAFMYGSKPEHIAVKMMRTVDEINGILGAIFRRYPRLSEWSKIPAYVNEVGRSQTLFGDEYVIDTNDYDRDKQIRRAVNMIPQGTAAGILKRVIDQVVRKPLTYWRFVVPVHDMVLVEVDVDRVNECSVELRSIMQSFLNGDLTVKMSLGTNWREAWEASPDLEFGGSSEE